MSLPAARDSLSPRFEFPVERGKILEFARSIQSHNPAFYGRHSIAPPTFLMVAGQIWGYSWERPGDSPLALVGVDPNRVLHLQESYEYVGSPPHAGDQLEGQLRLLPPVEKTGRRSGAMTLYTTETTFWSTSGEKVAHAVQVVAHLHRGGAEPESAISEPLPQAGESSIVGDDDPGARRFGALRLEDFVQYQAASGDLNPHHYDREVLEASGETRFFCPGMLLAGFLGGQVSDIYGAESVRAIGFRFREPVFLGEAVSCHVNALGAAPQDGELELELRCLRADGSVAVSGTARVEQTADG